MMKCFKTRKQQNYDTQEQCCVIEIQEQLITRLAECMKITVYNSVQFAELDLSNIKSTTSLILIRGGL